MQADIVAQGWELMFFGMGTVVLFLTLLVVTTTLMSWCVGRYFPDIEPPSRANGSPARSSHDATAAARQTHLVAAISAAIHQHRSGKR